jgi:hypothetical protein
MQIAWGKVWAEWWMGKTFQEVRRAVTDGILECVGHSPCSVLGDGATVTANHYRTTVQDLKEAILMKRPGLRRESNPSP